MATYRKISGVNVKSYSVDPDRTYPSAFEGNLYYNSSDGQFKYVGLGAGAWSSGGNLNTKRQYGQAAGNSTAAIAVGGRAGTNSGGSSTANAEKYDGSSWTEVGDLNTARDRLISGAGSSTSSMAVAGYIASPSSSSTANEEWDNSSWTEIAELNTARYTGASISPTGGVSTALNHFGGNGNKDNHEAWNGSAWTEVAEINTGRLELGSAGTPSAGLAMGGEDASDPSSSATESWNGSAWTEITEINTGRRAAGSSGTQTSALVFGNMVPYGGVTESWDGTSWTEIADLSTSRGTGCDGGTTGSNSDAIYAGGRGSDGGDALTATEEFAFAHAFKKVTTS
jgi:hypothetical protein